MRRTSKGIAAVVSLAFLAACAGAAGTAPRLRYVAKVRPEGPIAKASYASFEQSHTKGGWYFGPVNFRPAADLTLYLSEAEQKAGSGVLVNSDVELRVPFAIDIFFFGWARGTDVVRSGQ